MDLKFYRCKHCGQIIAMVKKTGVPVICCGEKMEEIIPGEVDASLEKHVPVYEVKGNKVIVRIGAVDHPMQPEHYIEWVCLQTKQGNQRKALNPGDAPCVCFSICDGDEVEAVYAYCNLHGLWKKQEEPMDKKALYSLTYGVFVVATRVGDKTNGCITNTCMQVANSPTRIAISCINANLTCEMLKESKVFTLSILDNTVSYDTIKYYGMQSGRDVDKFFAEKVNVDGIDCPYLSWSTCAVLTAKVVEMQDLGSHTLFIAELCDAFCLSDKEPVTYADYQNRIKPKPVVQKEKKIIAWRCKICGYIYEGAELPRDIICPLCGHDASDFEPIYES